MFERNRIILWQGLYFLNSYWIILSYKISSGANGYLKSFILLKVIREFPGIKFP